MHTGRLALQGASDARRPVLPPWWPQQRTPEGLQRIVKARTVHGGYSAESRRVAAMIRDLKAGAKRLMELT